MQMIDAWSRLNLSCRISLISLKFTFELTDMDNGKVLVYLKNKIPVVDVYHHGEINIQDISWIHQCILNLHVDMPCDVIIDRTGSYSLTPDAILALRDVFRDHKKVAYVIHHPVQEHAVKYARESYLNSNDVMQFQTLIEACEWMEGN